MTDWSQEAEQAARAIFARLFTDAIGAVFEAGIVPTASHLAHHYDFIRQSFAQEPTIKALWFIDCPSEYGRFLAHFVAPLKVNGISWVKLTGVVVHDWVSISFDPFQNVIGQEGDDLTELRKRTKASEAWPYICHYPGIWLEWSDGRFTHFPHNSQLELLEHV